MIPCPQKRCRARRSSAFTLPEVLVVIGVIAVLIAVLLPALAGALRTSDMAKSQNNLKQIALWSQQYSSDNRETILPSQFDYTVSAQTYPVKVRSDPNCPQRYQGTWTDILWTVFKLNSIDAGTQADIGTPYGYQFDSPDTIVYDQVPNFRDSPMRSAAPNSHDFVNGDGVPKPFGLGARESTNPGYFAANNFFNTGPAPTTAGDPPQKWWVTGQIKAPDRSMYLVDSVAGETIEPLPPAPGAVGGPFDNVMMNANGVPATLEVDFRYSGVCLMLFLDGHNQPVGPWQDIAELEGQRRIKVRNLDRN